MGRDSSVNGVNTLPTHTQGLQYSRYTCSEQRGGDGGRFLAEPFDLAVSSLPGFLKSDSYVYAYACACANIKKLRDLIHAEIARSDGTAQGNTSTENKI